MQLLRAFTVFQLSIIGEGETVASLSAFRKNPRRVKRMPSSFERRRIVDKNKRDRVAINERDGEDLPSRIIRGI